MMINKAVAITPRILTSIQNLLLTLNKCFALVFFIIFLDKPLVSVNLCP
jgi:hypothetical protein